MDRRPRFVLDKSIVSRLLAAFGRLYPRLSYEFDKMIVRIAEASENYKSYMEEMREMWKQQQNCEHMYKEPPSITLCGYYGKQGCKCHYIKKIKNPNSLRKR